MIRVLHVIDSLVSGGKERQFVELLKGLKRRPDITCAAVVMSEVIQYDAFHELGIETWKLPRRTRYDPGMFLRLSGVCRRFRPNIIHSWSSMCSVYAAPLSAMIGAKFVNFIVQSAPPSRSVERESFSRLALTMPFSDIIVGNSRAGLAAFRIPKRKALCIYNGFDTERLKDLADPSVLRRSLDIGSEKVVGMVARFSPSKDYGMFFNMAERMTALREDVVFLAVGAGPTLEVFQRRFESAHHSRIKLLGLRTDVENVINIFDVGVLVTNAKVHGEGVANSVMEYMALGKPTVVTDCGGNSELVVEGETGFLISDGDVESLAARVSKLLDDPETARRFGEAGATRVRNEFGLERMTDEFMQLYRRVLPPKTIVATPGTRGRKAAN